MGVAIDIITMRRVAPNYAFLAAAGFALVAFAASLTTIVETGIKADVHASVVVDTYKAWHKKHATGVEINPTPSM